MAASTSRTVSTAVATTLAGATVALKVAREATDAVPIAKQILGAAAHISELAEKINKKRDAMYSLVEKSGIYAHQIDIAVGGRVLDVQLQRRLERLYNVFREIEALLEKQTAPRTAALRALRNVFVLPNKAEALASDLESEMKLFQLATSIDTRLAVADTAREVEQNALYDGNWRRLRDGDVRKLQVIRQHEIDDGFITYSSARVDGELMTVRYLASSACPDETIIRGAPPRQEPWTTYHEVVQAISTVHNSHPWIVQYFGQRPGPPDATFSVFRTGTHDAHDLFCELVDTAPKDTIDSDPFGLKAATVSYKILDAARYLRRDHNLAWVGLSATMDDSGEPQIGLFDDIDTGEKWKDGAVKMFEFLMALRETQQPSDVKYAEEGGVLSDIYDGECFRLIASSMPSFVGLADALWELLRNEEVDVEVTTFYYAFRPDRIQLPASTIRDAQDYFNELWSACSDEAHVRMRSFLPLLILQNPSLSAATTISCTVSLEHCRISIENATEHDNGLLRVVSTIISLDPSSKLWDDVKKLLARDEDDDMVDVEFIQLTELECFAGHADCGFPRECSGFRRGYS
ncbi:hypothetical protein EXIGLDRAFT_841098 [Exidia glandulosa HHB12029]|uniref:Uncharacterized protein n=1 Tax=Exidia glandulosa HHB12029 TaxID=1314781 RepID=A0A165ZVG6_EXIGL|nr:hypothetical protein EXIGLDRAFT_841098 [Exidia glandulosa HHB12029]